MRKLQIGLTLIGIVGLGLAAGAHGGSSNRPDCDEGSRFCFSSIDVPGATVGSNAMGINARGDIVGAFTDAAGTHGYLLSDDAFSTIDYPDPGVVFTDARGINARGDIV